jgi:putative membrane protein
MNNTLMPFLVRLLVNAAALWVATRLVPGVSHEGGVLPMVGVALVFGVVNAFMGTVARVLSIPLIILTLGLFWFVINGFMLWLTSSLSSALGLGFHVTGFWPAFWGGLVVSLVSTVLSVLVTEPKRKDRLY